MKKLITTSIVLVSVASISGVAIGMSLNMPAPKPAETQLISKTADVTAQPASTSTTTQTTSQPKPAATTSPTSTPTTATTTATPVTVTSYKQISLDSQGDIDCELTYSDGTTYQWHWQTINPQGSWQTDGQEQNGHWVPATAQVGTCDGSVVGAVKTN